MPTWQELIGWGAITPNNSNAVDPATLTDTATIPLDNNLLSLIQGQGGIDYQGISNGTVKVDSNNFDSTMLSNADRQLSAGEFAMLSPDTQAWARNNPQQFAASLLANRNPANGDLGSVGAEGGYSNLGAITVSNNQLDYSNAGYLQVHDQNDLGIAVAVIGLGAAIFTAGSSLGLWGAGAAAAKGSAAAAAAAAEYGGTGAIVGGYGSGSLAGAGALDAGAAAASSAAAIDAAGSSFANGGGTLTAGYEGGIVSGETAASSGAIDLSGQYFNPVTNTYMDYGQVGSVGDTSASLTDFLPDPTNLTLKDIGSGIGSVFDIFTKGLSAIAAGAGVYKIFNPTTPPKTTLPTGTLPITTNLPPGTSGAGASNNPYASTLSTNGMRALTMGDNSQVPGGTPMTGATPQSAIVSGGIGDSAAFPLLALFGLILYAWHAKG